MKKRILTIAVAILTATAILVGIYAEYKETGKIDKDMPCVFYRLADSLTEK